LCSHSVPNPIHDVYLLLLHILSIGSISTIATHTVYWIYIYYCYTYYLLDLYLLLLHILSIGKTLISLLIYYGYDICNLCNLWMERCMSSPPFGCPCANCFYSSCVICGWKDAYPPLLSAALAPTVFIHLISPFPPYSSYLSFSTITYSLLCLYISFIGIIGMVYIPFIGIIGMVYIPFIGIIGMGMLCDRVTRPYYSVCLPGHLLEWVCCVIE